MKTIDIINLWSAFNRVYEDSSLTDMEKVAIGEEVLMQLPHPHLMTHAAAALAGVTRSIKDRVAELEKKGGKQEPEPVGPTPRQDDNQPGDGEEKRQGKPKPKQLLRKASANA